MADDPKMNAGDVSLLNAAKTGQGLVEVQPSPLAQIIATHAMRCRDVPDALGEILREWAFIGDGTGCYANFDVRPDLEQTEPGQREFEMLFGRSFDPSPVPDGSWGDPDSYYLERIRWYRHPCGIEVGWLWDGDGHLGFFVPELRDEFYTGFISNSDCKLDHGWRFHEQNDVEERTDD